MAAVEVTISGVLYDKLSRTTRPCVLIGEASLTGLEIGGGPLPGGPGKPGDPPHIWGGANEPFPGYGLPGQPPGIWGGPIDPYPDHGLPGQPPGIWGPTDPRPGYGLPKPQPPLPPGTEPPNPGDPTTPFPPPAGSGGWPVQPVTPPPYIVVNYPGIGPVVVAPPTQEQAQPQS